MSGLPLILIVLLGLVLMVLGITKLKMHPFIVLLLTAYFIGILTFMPVSEIVGTMTEGFGGIMANIGIVIIAGTIIGTILEKTGAALTMANTILGIFGKDRSVLTMSITGYVVSIPVFCDSGFVILSPLSRAIAEKSKVSLAVTATALSSGLYATHCLVPPTPGPIYMAAALKANLGMVIIFGLIVSIPALISGWIYAKKVASKYDIAPNPEETMDSLLEKYGSLPKPLESFAPILLPIILIAFKSIADFPSAPLGEGALRSFLNFIGDPVTALIIGVFLAIRLINSNYKDKTFDWVQDGIINAGMILAITGAGGALGAILRSLPLADAVSGFLLEYHVGLLLPFILAALLKTAMGASTVAMVTVAAMIAPLMGDLGLTSEVAKVLTVLAMGAGSMTVSHANDSYFWVVAKFSDMDTSTAYKTQTGVTLVEGIVSIVTIYILAAIFI
ncbi:GntP family permease [Iocasia frigidifontis]|uniref:GntP family permease n=1 Tax=Iocasia fonsfrigidae TaxID=2682810 RepID=A0A8A7KBC9_9FIRM|nr:GntP family permease [Iocasia fonsfrigidae]QTL99153.1 GntP family permease [Iocasia fonsfrigidae]